MKLSLGGGAAATGKPAGKLSISANESKAQGKLPSKVAAKPVANGKRTAFMNDDDDDDDDNEHETADEPIASTSKSSLKAASSKRSDPTRPSASKNPSRLLKRLHDSAVAEDPSIFAYDEVYDSMKAGAAAAEAARKAEKEAEGDKPKYVNQLLAAAELRKKDRIRAEDKLIEREREKEGDEFRDKEAFVTSAYKEQQAELRKAEEEERLKEGEPKLICNLCPIDSFHRPVSRTLRWLLLRVSPNHFKTSLWLLCTSLPDVEQQAKRPGGMAEYYKRELAKSEAVHAAAVAAAASQAPDAVGTSSLPAGLSLSKDAAELAARGPKSEAQIAAEAGQALGRHIAVNDEGQIIDKRELLTGGLNIKPRKKLGPALPPGVAGSGSGDASDQPELKGFALSIAERRQLNAAEELSQKERERRVREDEHSLGLHGLTVAERQRISRERQSKELERQMVEAQEKKRKAEEEKESEVVSKIARRNNDESKVEELKRKALERRLLRQKQQQEGGKAAESAALAHF